MGNILMGDDGIGIHAVQALQQNPMPGVTMVEIGTAILHGLSFVESADRVLVIDAAKGGHPPGTIYLFEATENTETRAVASIHAMGLREAARFLLRGAPPPITVIGVEPLVLEYGMELSAPVQAALPRVVELARETLLKWQRAAVFGPRILSGSERGRLVRAVPTSSRADEPSALRFTQRCIPQARCQGFGCSARGRRPAVNL
ncbi:MAG: hydrogenase maturation protease [Verrucomicrobia bacterium]|nr:hydrogenase maturation protease [Verrucomicrobiota bacterium]